MGQKDLSGKVINGIEVIKEIPNSGGCGKAKRWVCRCPSCNREVEIRQDRLLHRKTPCCTDCRRSIREDLTGQRFGRLTVTEMINPGKHKRSFCICTCDCGTTNVVVQANHLKFGETRSCGCLKSSPEEKIAELLSTNSIAFIREARFPGLRYKNALRCDFFLPDLNLVIEYNGEQHYKAIDHYGGEEMFRINQERDRIKREYCEAHNIQYMVIRFDEDIEEALIKNNIIVKR